MAGYSGTPLIRKLGYPAAGACAVINPPGSYAALLGLDAEPDVIDAAAPLPRGLDFLHLFTSSRPELIRILIDARSSLAPAGQLWVSWPKQASKLLSEITEDDIRAAALPLGLVDVKVCAVDETWSGLKLVIRKARR